MMNYKKIKTFENACVHVGIHAKSLPDFDSIMDELRKPLHAHYKLIIIAKALNDGWLPNWDDRNERKWTPWLYVSKDESKSSGFGLSLGGVVHWSTDTFVGSRLCFKSREIAEYAFETFKELFEDYMLIG